MTQPRAGVDEATVLTLARPTPDSEVRQRKGPGGKQLDYIDARYVMDTLDAAIGPGNWQDQYVDRTDGSVRGGIGILINGEWIWKWDVGTVSDIEPEKGSYSEAFKRAAVKWGIARDLYAHRPAAPQPPAKPATNGAARPAPRPATSTVPPEPEGFDELFVAAPQPVQNGHSAPVATSAQRMTMREMFAAAEAAGIDKTRLGAAAKKVYGKPMIRDLDDEQRAVVWAEVAR